MFSFPTPLWRPSWTPFALLLAPLGSLFGPLWPSFGTSGLPFESLEAALGPPWGTRARLLGHLGVPLAIQTPPRPPWDFFWDPLAPLGPQFWDLWAPIWAFWVPPGPSNPRKTLFFNGFPEVFWIFVFLCLSRSRLPFLWPLGPFKNHVGSPGGPFGIPWPPLAPHPGTVSESVVTFLRECRDFFDVRLGPWSPPFRRTWPLQASFLVSSPLWSFLWLSFLPFGFLFASPGPPKASENHGFP